MFKKTITVAALSLGSLLAVAAPAAATDYPAPEASDDVDQIGLLNVNDTLNNACLLPWGDGQVLAAKLPIFSGQQYQACNDGKAIQG